ncbi:AMP-binding protein [Actinoallomurus sp. NPDC052308]|uniref:AMP-binding protein n=1 Tax=Actinoallomurus sp. NPDC052308 TaxID=3155530 RepID=UPI003416ADEE
MRHMTPDVAAFRAARDFLLANAEDYETAYREFRWPEVAGFNWALDWFDGVLAAETPDRPALWIVEEDGSELKLTFAELANRSGRVAGWLRAHGVRRGDRILLMLGNQVELWETMLAAMKLGAVVVPATTLLTPDDLRDRVARGGVSHVVTGAADTAKFAGLTGELTRICVGTADGWLSYGDAYGHEPYDGTGTTTHAGDTLLLYFTSGTTARPKLVEHTYASYPVGHLSTMYWIGLRPGDVHLNVSSPGWAKHAWSNVFAPWNAGACVLVLNYARFSAPTLLEVMRRCEVTTFCAPPTVWRMLIQEDLRSWRLNLRITVAAGEPLNPEIIDQVREQWGLTVRDGYGQTETTAQIGNSPGQPLKPGSMGRPLPGYRIALIDPVSGRPADEGEVCIDLSERPVALMAGYRDATGRTDEAMDGGYYHTGDVASVDADGYVTFVGRTDDVFKASDYKISPFELESVLLEHDAVAEAAVVPAADPVRLAVPKAYVSLAAGHEATAETARSILAHCRQRLAPYKRVRRLEFGELPKTISGKIRRVELRGLEGADRRAGEFREEDFPDLRS